MVFNKVREMKDDPSSGSVEQRIEDLIKDLIYSGKLNPGEKIPSEHELADRFNTNRNQARHALSLLETEGLIFRRQGSGSYVREIKKQPMPGMDKNTMTVAIAVNQITCRYGKKITSTLMDTLDQNGIQTITFNLNSNDENEYRFIHDVHYGGYNGLALWPQHTGPLIRKMLNSVCKDRFPVVLYDHFFEDVPYDSVCTDNEDIGVRLTEELLREGCTCPAFVGLEYSANYSSTQARLNGMVSAMRNSGCFQNNPQIITLPGEKPGTIGIDPLLKAMAAPRRPDGLFFIYSGIAEVVLPHLKALGWKIGTNLKVAFVDDTLYRKKAGCPVIAIEQPAEKTGREAAKLLLQRIKNPDKPIVRKFFKGSRIFKK